MKSYLLIYFRRERSKMKIFTDAVHGQISISRAHCTQIVDTFLFQRLKRVGQSFASSLFPTATHDRFTHSLGVYHMGRLLIDALEKNSKKHLEDLINQNNDSSVLESYIYIYNVDKTYYDTLKESFLLACLLHDCAHSPFSHTFEPYYLLQEETYEGQTIPAIAKEIIGAAKRIDGQNTRKGSVGEFFIRDFLKHIEYDREKVKPHEYVSAWLLLQEEGFYNLLTTAPLYADPLLMARMIMGVPFSLCEKDEKATYLHEILNCYISLLNGGLIDADRLDYACRDRWAMGLTSSQLNIQRLLSSIRIGELENGKKYGIVFTKKAIVELRALIDNKNFSNQHVFTHHKFKILEKYLIKSVTCLAILLCGQGNNYNKLYRNGKDPRIDEDGDIEKGIWIMGNRSLQKLFDYNSYIKQIKFSFAFSKEEIPVYETIKYPCDDDIISLLKKYFSDDDPSNPLIHHGHEALQTWFARKKNYIPVWKSYEEFVGLMVKEMKMRIKSQYERLGRYERIFIDASASIWENFLRYLLTIQQIEGLPELSDCQFLTIKHHDSDSLEKMSELYIQLQGKNIPYNELYSSPPNKKKCTPDIFYMYIRIGGHEWKQSQHAYDFFIKAISKIKDDEIEKFVETSSPEGSLSNAI